MDQVPLKTSSCRRIRQYASILLSLPFAVGCSGPTMNFEVAAQTESFSQNGESVNSKVDILWMIDSSGTMAIHQSNVAANFGTFISEFTTKSLDYRMVVASTDAWVREYNYNPSGCVSNPNPSHSPQTLYQSGSDCEMTRATYGQLASFRDGDIYGEVNGNAGIRSGTYLMGSHQSVSQVQSLFNINAKVGTRGDSRESGLQSLRAVLRVDESGKPAYGNETHTVLSSFRRPDAFLAVIIVSDEEDVSRKFSGSGYASTAEYVSAFRGFLNGYAGAGNYSVSSVVVNNIQNCSAQIQAQSIQSERYVEIANATGGVVGDLCSPVFSERLQEIARKVINLATRFPLGREPDVATLRVFVNGAAVPQSATNGWTYTAVDSRHFVTFHGSAVPRNGASISVEYTPLSPN